MENKFILPSNSKFVLILLHYQLSIINYQLINYETKRACC